MIFNKRVLLASTTFCLVCFCTAETLLAADSPEKIVDANFAPGREARINVNSKLVGIDHFMVYVPSDYNDKQDWPVIFFYPGQGGQPMTWPFKQITCGKGFVVVGMGYVPGSENPMNQGQYINYIKRLRKSAFEVKKYISERLRIDDKRFFITGCSKGGWYISSILESSSKAWAGAVILAAGRSQNARLIATGANRKALRGKPIYIGAGERDVNLASAQKAVVYYKRLGAEVTFEEYKGAGHICAPPNPEKLYSWFITNSAVEEAKSDKADSGGR